MSDFQKFFGGQNKLKYLFGKMIIEMMDITNSSQENEKQKNHHYHWFYSGNNVFTFTSSRLSINGLTNN